MESNLFQKLLTITDEIGKIEKTGKNDLQHYNFIEAAEVTVQVKSLLIKHGVMIIPSATNQVVHPKEKGAKVTLDINYTLVNTDKPTERMEVSWVGEGDDSLDKATQKAATSAHKYFLMKLFNISDREDPDSESPEVGKSVVSDKPTQPKKLSTEQVTELIDNVKAKGVGDKNEAINLLNLTLGAPNFAMLPGVNFPIYKKKIDELVISKEPF